MSIYTVLARNVFGTKEVTQEQRAEVRERLVNHLSGQSDPDITLALLGLYL